MGIILIIVVTALFFWIRTHRQNIFSEKDPITGKFRKAKPNFRKELEENFSYYHYLDQFSKRRFEARVQAFINSKKFIPRAYTHVSDQMKALIAGAAVQLTFGFEEITFKHFKKILIYKDNYYSSITQKYHQGEVNIQGFIVLSWRNFVLDYRDDSDGKNLGLHEMAHALRLENAIANGEFGFIDENILNDFDALAKDEILRMRSGATFFRPYGASNLSEFFAVAVENFFERALPFKEYNPELYLCLSKLLKQDPAALINRYGSEKANS